MERKQNSLQIVDKDGNINLADLPETTKKIIETRILAPKGQLHAPWLIGLTPEELREEDIMKVLGLIGDFLRSNPEKIYIPLKP